MAISAKRAERRTLRTVFARPDGAVLDLPDVEAAADSGIPSSADPADFIPLPAGSLLLTLPGRSICGFACDSPVVMDEYDGDEVCAVAAALPPGYTRLALPAYVERERAPRLPLYGYTAVAWSESGLRVAAARTDELESWAPQTHSGQRVRQAVELRLRKVPGNLLLQQLARCATEYGCFTAQNVFLQQGEAALPVSPGCNARCIGCISQLEPTAEVSSAQARVRRRPSVDEICSIAIAHLKAVPRGLVSFGQGCEGEPLAAAPLIERAIRRIRAATRAGIIHCNTNASLPKALHRLIDAGLQSIRVSLNSARPAVYAAYYRPRGYGFADVLESVRVAAAGGLLISLNLLTHPGVTDDEAEMEALRGLLLAFPIRMVQTRTLNVDPAAYFSAVGRPKQKPLGMRRWLAWLRKGFPGIRVGNFTRGFG